jgi:CRP/FNR family transcriptional regulator, cyclic AMP receptor protein
MYIVQSQLFKGLDKKTLDAVIGQGTERSYKRDDLVFREGDEATTFYILKDGAVDLVMGSQEELCFVVNVPGELFGWSALVEPYRYRATARCTAGARLAEIRREAINKLVREYPEAGVLIFKNLATIVAEKLRRVYQERISDADLEGVFFSTNEGLQRLP